MPNYGLDYTFQTHRPEVDAITDFFAKRKAESDRQQRIQGLVDFMDKNKSVQVSGGTPMQTEQRSLPPIGQSTPTGFQFQPRSETVPTQLSPVTQTEKPFSLSSATPDQMAKVYDIAGGSAGDVLGALSSRDAASQKLQQEMAMKEIESKLTEQREMNVAAPRNAMEQRRIDSEDSF